jgi:hypothetical protein
MFYGRAQLPNDSDFSPVDKHRPGYPRYCALLSSHPSFQNFRRFTRIRMRLLLLKQDEISVLEERLDSLDSSEDRGLFLGSMRQDSNPRRLQVIQSLNTALAEYGSSTIPKDWDGHTRCLWNNDLSYLDELIERCHRVLLLPESWDRDIDNLRKWTSATGYLSRQELKYLERDRDLVNLTGTPDPAISFSELIVEDCIFWCERTIGRVRHSHHH